MNSAFFSERIPSMGILAQMPLGNLCKLQQVSLFLAVVMIPLVCPPLFTKYLGPLCFYGQPSSVPVLIGLFLASVEIYRNGRFREVFIPLAMVGFAYLILISIVSIHSIVNFHGDWTVDVFGHSFRVDAIKQILLMMGIDESWSYRIIVFFKDFRSGVHEFVFLFCFVLWIALLYCRDKIGTFSLIRKAIVVDFLILFLYCFIEVCHLYGGVWATEILERVNPFFYMPKQHLGWYPPIVSSSQVRGIWTEPAYFSFWLAFAVPFFVHWLLDKRNFLFNRGQKLNLNCQEQGINSRGSLKDFLGIFVRFFSFLCLFSIWSMTYARTSVWLMFIMVIAYFLGVLIYHNRQFFSQFSYILVAFSLAFFLVTNFGPADINRYKSSNRVAINQPIKKGVGKVEQSRFIQNTVQSAFDSKSRSTPARIQFWTCRFEIFKDSPVFGVGDSLEPWYEARKYVDFWGKRLSGELKHRANWAKERGLLNAGFGGNNLLIVGMLACRGLIGTLLFAIPILCIFFRLYCLMFSRREDERNSLELFCITTSCSVGSLTALTQGLWFFNMWPAIGLALGFVFWNSLQRTRNM